jgi:hypothetical protein
MAEFSARRRVGKDPRRRDDRRDVLPRLHPDPPVLLVEQRLAPPVDYQVEQGRLAHDKVTAAILKVPPTSLTLSSRMVLAGK